MTVPVQSRAWIEARKLRDAGYGWNDLVVKIPGLTEAEARLIVFGMDAFLRWAMRRKVP